MSVASIEIACDCFLIMKPCCIELIKSNNAYYFFSGVEYPNQYTMVMPDPGRPFRDRTVPPSGRKQTGQRLD